MVHRRDGNSRWHRRGTPWFVDILPILTPLAATGLAIVMILAAVYHLTRREYPNIVFNLVLVALAAFVAYGRFID